MEKKTSDDGLIAFIFGVILLCFWLPSKCSSSEEVAVPPVSISRRGIIDSAQLSEIFKNSMIGFGFNVDQSRIENWKNFQQNATQNPSKYTLGVDPKLNRQMTSPLNLNFGKSSSINVKTGFKQTGTDVTNTLGNGLNPTTSGKTKDYLSVPPLDTYSTNESERLGIKK